MSRCTICVNLPVPCIQSHAGRVIDDNRAPAGAQVSRDALVAAVERIARRIVNTLPAFEVGDEIDVARGIARGVVNIDLRPFLDAAFRETAPQPQADRAALVERLSDIAQRAADADVFREAFGLTDEEIATLREVARLISAPAFATEYPIAGTSGTFSPPLGGGVMHAHPDGSATMHDADKRCPECAEATKRGAEAPDRPPVHVSPRGVSYVDPDDLVQSQAFRAAIAPGTRQEEDRQRRVGPGTDAPDRLGIGEAEATPLREAPAVGERGES